MSVEATEASREAAQKLRDKFSGKIKEPVEFRGEVSVIVEREIIADVAAYLHDELGFDYLVDLSGLDNFGEEPRFEVVYEFARMEKGDHLRVKLSVSEDDLTVPSIMGTYATADWHEREAFDMYGIRFSDHPDLRRILMWPGYPYYPLRKDFPLEGKPSDMPGEAFSKVAPLAGGPFVSSPQQGGLSHKSEPRSREVVE